MRKEIRICDRCGKEITEIKQGRINYERPNGLPKNWFDLCVDCSEKFEKFMDSKNEKHLAS